MKSVTSNLKFLVGKCIQAIDQSDSRSLQEILKRYRGIVDEVNSKTASAKNINKSAANRVSQTIVDDFELLCAHSLNQPTQTFTTHILNSQGNLLSTTLRKSNPIIGDQLPEAFFRAYQIGSQSGNPSPNFVDRLMDNLAQPMNRIPSELTRADCKNSIKRISKIGNAIAEVYWKLFLSAIDKEDRYLFEICWEGFDLMDTGISLQSQIDAYQDLDEDESSVVKNQFDIDDVALEQCRRDYFDELTERLSKYRFAAAAWAFRQYREENISNKFFSDIFTQLIYQDYNQSDLNTVSELYFNISLEDDRLLDSGRHDEVSPMKQSWSFSSSTQSWLLDFYSFIGPFIISDNSVEAVLDQGETPVPVTESVAARYNSVEDRISEFGTEYGDWQQKLDIEFTERKKDAFREAHSLAKNQFRSDELDEIREADPNPEKIREFKQDAVKSFISDFKLRNALESFSSIEKESNISNDIKNVSYLDFVPKSRFTNLQHFHMSSDPRVRPLLSLIMNRVINESSLRVESVQDNQNLPEHLLNAVDQMSELENAIILTTPGISFGEYLSYDRFTRPSGNENQSFGVSFRLDDTPVVMDHSIGKAGYSAIILNDLQAVSWTELIREGSPLGITIAHGKDTIQEFVDEYDVSGFEYGTGRPMVAVEYEYVFVVDDTALSGVALKNPDAD